MIEARNKLRAKFDDMHTRSEHGGNLYSMSPLDLAHNLRDEAIDAFNYAQTLIDTLSEEGEKHD